jgi:hypothetical protein
MNEQQESPIQEACKPIAAIAIGTVLFTQACTTTVPSWAYRRRLDLRRFQRSAACLSPGAALAAAADSLSLLDYRRVLRAKIIGSVRPARQHRQANGPAQEKQGQINAVN